MFRTELTRTASINRNDFRINSWTLVDVPLSCRGLVIVGDLFMLDRASVCCLFLDEIALHFSLSLAQ